MSEYQSPNPEIVAVPLAYDRAGLAAALSISLAMVDNMNNTGAIPRPVDLSLRCPRWSRREVEAWLLSGSPRRPRWEAVREQALKKFS